MKWLHLINSVAAHFWGFVFEVLPSAYSERKCASSVELFPLSALCLDGSTFTQITIQLLAKNKENRETHYCSSGLPVGFIFSRGESAKHSRNNCSMCASVFVCVRPCACMNRWSSVLSHRAVRPQKCDVLWELSVLKYGFPFNPSVVCF